MPPTAATTTGLSQQHVIASSNTAAATSGCGATPKSAIPLRILPAPEPWFVRSAPHALSDLQLSVGVWSDWTRCEGVS